MLARILRLPLSLIPREAGVRILRGPLRGMRWVKGAGPNAYWFGTYEVSRVRAFANKLAPGAVVYDVGDKCGHLLSSGQFTGGPLEGSTPSSR